MEVTEELAHFIVSTRYQDLPREVINTAKLCLLDWLGVTFAGAKEPLVEILLDVARLVGGEEQATVIGRGIKTSVLNASLLNGSASHTLDFDDVHIVMTGHPSVPVIPALLAISEWRGLSGKEFITALVTGIETECRIGAGVFPYHYLEGWHSTATLGRFGAAAGSAKLLNLSPPQVVYALGIAGTQAAGLKQMFGTMCKPFHAGKAAMDGVLAALLAQRGFTSSRDILEGEKGFCQVLSSKSDPDAIVENLGQRYAIEDVIFKRHASCFETHPTIEAVLALREKVAIEPEEVKEMDVAVSSVAAEVADKSEPSTGLEGKFSLSYCAALALMGGEVQKSCFTDEKVRDPQLVKLRKKITVRADSSIGHDEAAVTVTTVDGREYSQKVDIGKLKLEPQQKYDSLVRKFRELTSPILPDKQTDQLLSLLNKLEEVNNMADLVKLCY